MTRLDRRVVLVLVLAGLALASTARARADELASGLASPRAPAAAEAGDPWSFDLVASSLLPLSIGATMIFEMPAGFQLRVGGGVVPPAFVDAINDVGAAWSLWDDGTAGALRELLVDAILIEAGIALRPGLGPIEIGASYVLLWSEGPAPTQMAVLDATSMSVSAYAVHAEIALRLPVGDVMVFRLALGWLHTVAREVSVGMAVGTDDAEGRRAALESTVSDWVGSYGLGPTLSGSLGFHLE